MAKRKNGRVILEADVTSFAEKMNEDEIVPETMDDILKLVIEDKMHPGDVGIRHTIAHETGMVKGARLTWSNDITMIVGTTSNVAQMIKARKQKTELANGKEVELPIANGVGGRPAKEAAEGVESTAENSVQNKLAGYAYSISKAGGERAEQHLRTVVTGHIYNHMKIMAANEMDLEEVAQFLKDFIDATIKELT